MADEKTIQKVTTEDIQIELKKNSQSITFRVRVCGDMAVVTDSSVLTSLYTL